ncbi:MAG TPA: chemotaxis protein CheX [Ruminococcaceae bacterium]|nr:chemotaxis protein CheX [Oscillospiraceae bacterium]
MDLNYIHPFVEAFTDVMPQLGFSDIQLGAVAAKDKNTAYSGVVIILGIVGDVKGNVVYTMSVEAAKHLASSMMMGMPVEEFDDMAKSAVSELTNMVTANAATVFSNIGIMIDISTPSMLQGENIMINCNSNNIMCAQLFVDKIPLEINLYFEHKNEFI